MITSRYHDHGGFDNATNQAIVRHVRHMYEYANEPAQNGVGLAMMEIPVLLQLMGIERTLTPTQEYLLLQMTLRNNTAVPRIVNNRARTLVPGAATGLANLFEGQFVDALNRVINETATAVEVPTVAGTRRPREETESDEEEGPLFVFESESRAPSQPAAGQGAVAHQPRLANDDDVDDDWITDDDIDVDEFGLPYYPAAQPVTMIPGFWNDLDNNDLRNDPSVPYQRMRAREPFKLYRHAVMRGVQPPKTVEAWRHANAPLRNRDEENAAHDRATENMERVLYGGPPNYPDPLLLLDTRRTAEELDLNPRPPRHFIVDLNAIRPAVRQYLANAENPQEELILREVEQLPIMTHEEIRDYFENMARDFLIDHNRRPANPQMVNLNQIATDGDYEGMATMLAIGLADLVSRPDAIIEIPPKEQNQGNPTT